MFNNTLCTATGQSLISIFEDYRSFVNTSKNSAEVTGLQPGICYKFGVRMYSSRSIIPGEWTLILQQTQTSKCDFDVQMNLRLNFQESHLKT